MSTSVAASASLPPICAPRVMTARSAVCPLTPLIGSPLLAPCTPLYHSRRALPGVCRKMRKLEAGVPSANVDAMLQREKELFVQRHPKSYALAQRAKAHWAHGVPMHWMLDWGTPFPIHVASAKGSRLEDVDGHSYDDFCFGDTGSMFGHSP